MKTMQCATLTFLVVILTINKSEGVATLEHDDSKSYKWYINNKVFCVFKLKIDRVTDTQGYSVYGWVKVFCASFQ